MRNWGVAAVVALSVAALAGAAWLLAGSAGPRGGVAVLGDAAPALHAAMGTQQALPLHTAAITVVSVQGWERLRYMPDMADLCGRDCYGDSGLVRVVPLSPSGARKYVFVNLEAWSGTQGIARPTEEKDYACVAAAVRAEFAGVRPGTLPDCAAGVPVAGGTRWVLPAGLGAL